VYNVGVELSALRQRGASVD